ncbi:MAG: glycoside hydrolase family 2 TIM barrel-domain containing protein [Chthoniobacteraceae bacterium]|nr:glycoside hydrolase family 2 TIM barrel-domain containing protein [Chthoniobacteraceae bacterium]
MTTSLNGLWDFEFLGDVAVEAIDPSGTAATGKMPVPSAFDALPDYAGRRGAAIYRTRFTASPNHPVRLEFGAVSFWCRVYVDGMFLAEHACGYSPFTVDVPGAAGETRELTVLLDNRFDFARVPMHEEYFDFYQYGGILREVTLRELPVSGPFVDAVQVTPTADFRRGEVEISLFLGGTVPATIAFTTRFDQGAIQRHQAAVEPGNRVRITLCVPGAKPWSPDSPHLHELAAALCDQDGRPRGDTVKARFGLRRIESRQGALLLNGEKLQLRGYNRHEWHPSCGPCTSPMQMVADLQLLRDLGCNFVRGCHYPQDQRFLDLCDEFGFLVWEENLGWGQREQTLTDPKFRRDHLAALREMVRASFNHPSVIIWGFLNEAGTNQDYARPVIEETVETLRALDPSRLVTYATMFPTTDKHYDLVDIISLNIYPGWYECEGVEHPLDLIAPRIEECMAYLDAHCWVDKPVLLSEIGAEGLYGWHDPHNDFFSEEHQAEYLRRAASAAMHHPRCSGIALWQFCDVRTYGGGRSIKRPRTFNNKGTLDEYRRPKAAYRAVREVFRAAKSNP